MDSESTWPRCSVYSCQHDVVANTPYCHAHIPVGSFVTADQVAQTKFLMRKGANLYQAAMRVKADVRDLDVALWERLGQPHRPAPQF